MRHRTVVVGGSFAGLTCALELKDRLGDAHDVVLVSKRSDFVFLPSLVWVPFGLRGRADLTFHLPPVVERRGVEFREAEVRAIDLPGRTVVLGDARLAYDTLVLATGQEPNWEAVPGLGPHRGHTCSVFSLDEAVAAQQAVARLFERPGPVVVGAAPGASFVTAAYEFVFNLAHQLRKRGLGEPGGPAPLTLVTPEPYAGHLGLGGFGRLNTVIEDHLAAAGISLVVDAALTRVEPGRVVLADGTTLPFTLAMIAPPTRGIAALRALTESGLGVTGEGFLRVDDTYRLPGHPEVFACGACVAIEAPDPTRVPLDVPCTGYVAEEMARVVAFNVAARIAGRKPVHLPPESIDAKYVLDMGDSGLILSGDHLLAPREHAHTVPGPQGHWAKVAFERYFMATRRRGIV